MQRTTKTKHIGAASVATLFLVGAFGFGYFSNVNTADAYEQTSADEQIFGDINNMSDEEIQEMNEIAQEQIANTEAEYQAQIQTNEYGQTYGSGLAGDMMSGKGEPDLIAVQATNGEHGYMYWTDAHEIYVRDYTVTPEELEVTGPQSEATLNSLSTKASVPVYLSDGRTQIGVYLVDTGGAWATGDLRERMAEAKANVKVNASGQTYGSVMACDDIGTLEGAPDLIEFETTDGQDGYMYFEEYWRLKQSQEFQDKIMTGEKTYLPVYLSDGTTQIGVGLVE